MKKRQDSLQKREWNDKEKSCFEIIEKSGQFDEEFYRKRYGKEIADRMTPLEHYIEEGQYKGYNPCEWFDSEFYLLEYPDVSESESNPFVHYLLYGKKEGRLPSALKSQSDLPEGRQRWNDKEKSCFEIIEKSGQFDEEFYRKRYGKEIADGMTPLEHYIEEGQYKGYDPCEWFDSAFYLLKYPDIAESRSNPFVHYLLYGKEEGRFPSARESESRLSDNGKNEKGLRRASEFDPEFCRAFYDDLKDLETYADLMAHWRVHGRKEKRHPTLESLCKEIDFGFDLSAIDIDTVQRLNPFLSNLNRSEIFLKILQVKEIDPIRISDEKLFDADFYLQLAIAYLLKGEKDKAHQLLLYSLYLHPTVKSNELVGNYYLENGQRRQALTFYRDALENIKSSEYRSFWLYMNTARIYRELDQTEEALSVIQSGLQEFPLHHQLEKALDEMVQGLWEQEQGELHALAKIGRRDELVERTRNLVNLVSDSYRNLFPDTQSPSRVSLNPKQVLIVGDFHIPQCIRYRIEQKKEQLEMAGYEVSRIPWTELSERYDEIFFHDIIIFYRVPALPVVVKAIEQSRALGKVTFYEIDDLIFDSIYPPPYETYGGNISIEEYAGLTYGMPLFQAAASLCEYAIGSTMPLVSRLGELVTSGRAFLHRNGLDSKNIFMEKKRKEYISIFYGSGTLAHNSDFIDLVLEPLGRILDEYDKVKLVIVGHLTLPESFVKRHEEQLVLLEKTKTIEAYWSYLSGADINLAVLHNDVINNAKSELKWFEAATFKIPSIVSDTQNYLDVVENGKDALIASTTEEWYEALNALVKSEKLRDEIGENAYYKVRKNYSLEALSANIDNIIHSVLEERGSL